MSRESGHGRPRSHHCRANSTGPRSQYLFSGLLVCGQWRGEVRHLRGDEVRLQHVAHAGRLGLLEHAQGPARAHRDLLLASIQRDLFTEEGLAVFKQEVARLLADHRRTRKPDLAQATARLQVVEQEIAYIMEAIKQGILTPTTKAELEQAEAERTRLRQTVQGSHTRLAQVATFLPNMAERFKRVVDDLATVTQHQVDKARGILRDLVGQTIPLHPTADGATRFLTAELAGDYSGLVRLVCGPKINLVAVTRIERVTRGL